MRRISLVATTLLAAAAGCGDQAPPSYEGDTLASLHGVLVSELAQPLPEVDVVIGWPDWSQGDGTSAPFASFMRLSVDATLPARFSATILEPPPATAYHVPSETYPRYVGPRFTSAVILLARKGREVTSTSHLSLDLALKNPDEAVLTSFDDYLLTYYESGGTPSAQLEDGSVVPLSGPVTKGFHLVRQDRVICANSFDEECIARNVSLFGFPEASAWQGCVSTMEKVTAVEVPLDSEVTLTLKDPNAAEQRPPLCPTPSAG